jgi:hypothetical protein
MRRCITLVGWLWIGWLLLGAGPIGAQPSDTATFRGTVVDSTSGEPLPGAHVFIATSMIGTTTDTDGRFRLTGVPAGVQRLYASMLGYQSAAVDTLVRANQSYTLRLRLQPTVLESEGVVVEAERDEEWRERLAKFERLFIGTSRNADHCTLMNPEVLQFEDGWLKPFRAKATAPLLIENHALGYRVRYFLKEFTAEGPTVKWDGEPLFEPLTPKDSAEAAKWRQNRRRAYRGSLRHFLLALIHDRVDDAGFIVHRRPHASPFRSAAREVKHPVDADELLESVPDTSLWKLDFHGRLEIVYPEEMENERFFRWQRRVHHDGPGPQTSFIRLNEPHVTIDATGDIVEPYGATIFGYFAFERLADLTPQEYRPR